MVDFRFVALCWKYLDKMCHVLLYEQFVGWQFDNISYFCVQESQQNKENI